MPIKPNKYQLTEVIPYLSNCGSSLLLRSSILYNIKISAMCICKVKLALKTFLMTDEITAHSNPLSSSSNT